MGMQTVSMCLRFPISVFRNQSNQWGFGLLVLQRGWWKRLGKEKGLRLGSCYCNLNSKSTNSFHHQKLEPCQVRKEVWTWPRLWTWPRPATGGWALETWRAVANTVLQQCSVLSQIISQPAAQTIHLINLLLNYLLSSRVRENHSFWLPALLQGLIQSSLSLTVWWSSLVPTTLWPRQKCKETANEVFLKKRGSLLECKQLPWSQEAQQAPLKHIRRGLFHVWAWSVPHPFYPKVLFPLNGCQQLQGSILHRTIEPAFPTEEEMMQNPITSHLQDFWSAPKFPHMNSFSLTPRFLGQLIHTLTPS